MYRSVKDEVLVIATDGLWDVFSCKEATTLASRCIVRSKVRFETHQHEQDRSTAEWGLQSEPGCALLPTAVHSTLSTILS